MASGHYGTSKVACVREWVWRQCRAVGGGRRWRELVDQAMDTNELGVAREALNDVSVGYTNLEYDLERGARGSRHDHCAALLMELTGAGGALIVNNNAAAVVLAVDELAHGREVIVSRGELVEIGGSFRVPDIVAKSGAHIVEVGTTNRTHARDYEGAIGPETGAVLKVHQSNFRQSGFVAEVDITELAEIAHRHDRPVIHDLGSGLLPEAESLGLPWEPSVRGSLAAGDRHRI